MWELHVTHRVESESSNVVGTRRSNLQRARKQARLNREVNRHLSTKLLPLLFIAVTVFAAACTLDDHASPTPEFGQAPVSSDTPTVVPAATSTPIPTPTPSPTPIPPTQRVIILQGVCSSSAVNGQPTHWTNVVKRILDSEYGLIDLPTGDPDDQVIEFGYSAAGWEQDYLPGDTLKGVGASSAGLREIYASYPNSEFFILGHSLGGVVALDGLARHSDSENGMIASTAGVITVSSPVRGLVDRTASAAGAAIELLACRQLPVLDGSSQVWGDLAESGDSISLIHDFDWSSVRTVNFGNQKDRVVDVETAVLPRLFEVSCYDEGDIGFLELNHETLLSEITLARELLKVLLNGAKPQSDCAAVLVS